MTSDSCWRPFGCSQHHALAAIRVRSDFERKRLAGIEPHLCAAAAVRQGIYSAEFSHRTYGRLADCAENCLRARFSTIVDAAFLDATDRELFRNLATRLRASHAIVSCRADPLTLAARVTERCRARKDPSDADLNVLDAQLRSLEPFATIEENHVVTVDTNDANVVQRVVAAVDAVAGRVSA